LAEPHLWLSRIGKLGYPDQMVFDLDPSGDDFAPVKRAAQSLRHLLDELRLPVYLKTTGSHGLHIAVPLDRQEDFDSVRAFARRLAQVLVNENPDERTIEQRKSTRRGRVFIDTNRNAYAQTVAPVYALRARRGAPVSVPLHWDELKNTLVPKASRSETPSTGLNRIEDLGAAFGRRGISLINARKQMDEPKA
jgi:bifunctional non-homologous end joining protein LigD